MCETPEGQTGPDPGVPDSLLGVKDKDLRSAGWSPVSDARLAATQTWRCTGTGAHLGVCRLGVETVRGPEEWGGVCLSMRTEKLPLH